MDTQGDSVIREAEKWFSGRASTTSCCRSLAQHQQSTPVRAWRHVGSGEAPSGQFVPRTDDGCKGTEQVGDAVRVIRHEITASREQRVPVARLHKDATHAQHPPGALPALRDVPIGADHTPVQLHQHRTHLLHAVEERHARNVVAFHALNRSAGERNWCHRNEESNPDHHLIAEVLDATQALGASHLKQVPLALEPLDQGNRRADGDRRSSVALPATRREARRVPPEIASDLAHLRQPRLAASALRHRQLAQERAVLEHAVVVHRNRHDEETRPERGISCDAENVVEKADLRWPQLPIAREATLEEDSLSDTLSRDELYVSLEHRVIQRLSEPAPNEIRTERLEQVLERKGARPLPHRI